MARKLALAVLAVLLAWLIAQVALDDYLVAQGRRDLLLVARGESRLSFEFDSARELLVASEDGLHGVDVDAGVLSATAPDGRANLRLNLRGLTLDANRFAHLAARIEVSAPARISLIFDEPGRLEQWQFSTELNAGWNELSLALASLPWSAHAGALQQRWGGASGRVGELRLYVSGPAALQIGLDYLRLLTSPSHALPTNDGNAIEWISAATARARLQANQPLRARADARLGVLLAWDTPERSLDLRDRVRAIDAEALFWPAWRALPELTREDPAPRLTGWAPGWLGLALYTLLAGLQRWRWRGETRGHALIELALGFGPLLALTLGLGLAEQLSRLTLAWLLAAVGYQLAGLRFSRAALVGRNDAWLANLRFSSVAAAALLAIAAVCSHVEAPGIQRIAVYVPFVLLQQALLLGFLWPRARLISFRHARGLTAALFALVHAPNFALMGLTFVAAWFWTGLYQRHLTWLPIVTSHYLLGLLAISCLPPWLLYSAEAGLRYFQVR